MQEFSTGMRPVQCDLSVCLLTWNGKDLTLACLASLYEHTAGINFEVIIVDNGSSDGTGEAIREQFPCVKLIINDRNRGFTVPNNQAIQVSSGRYVILLNNDTLFTRNALKSMGEYLDQNPEVAVVGCKLRLPSGRIQRSAHTSMTWWDYVFAAFYLHHLLPKSKIFGRINMTFMDYQTTTADVDWVAAAAMMVRSSAIGEVGPLDERIFAFSEDWEWCIRFKRHGWRVVYFAGTEITHSEGMSSHSRSGLKGDEVRQWSILTAAASASYVYSKLNSRPQRENRLFDLSRRLFYLSKAVSFAILNILSGTGREWGRVNGYLRAALIRRRQLWDVYLRQVAGPSDSMGYNHCGGRQLDDKRDECFSEF